MLVEKRGRPPKNYTRDPLDEVINGPRIVKLTVAMDESLRIRAHRKALRSGITLSDKIRDTLRRWAADEVDP